MRVRRCRRALVSPSADTGGLHSRCAATLRPLGVGGRLGEDIGDQRDQLQHSIEGPAQTPTSGRIPAAPGGERPARHSRGAAPASEPPHWHRTMGGDPPIDGSGPLHRPKCLRRAGTPRGVDPPAPDPSTDAHRWGDPPTPAARQPRSPTGSAARTPPPRRCAALRHHGPPHGPGMGLRATCPGPPSRRSPVASIRGASGSHWGVGGRGCRGPKSRSWRIMLVRIRGPGRARGRAPREPSKGRAHPRPSATMPARRPPPVRASRPTRAPSQRSSAGRAADS